MDRLTFPDSYGLISKCSSREQLRKKGEQYLYDQHRALKGENFGITWASLALMASLLLSPGSASHDNIWWEQAPPPVVHGKVMPCHWWEEAKRSSKRYHVNPFLVAAVAWVEGNGWDGDRIGNSPYWGPMGLNEKNRKIPRWKLHDDLANIRLGARALRGKAPAALKRYNTEWDKNHYISDVMALTRQLERKARKEVSLTFEGKVRRAIRREG